MSCIDVPDTPSQKYRMADFDDKKRKARFNIKSVLLTPTGIMTLGIVLILLFFEAMYFVSSIAATEERMQSLLEAKVKAAIDGKSSAEANSERRAASLEESVTAITDRVSKLSAALDSLSKSSSDEVAEFKANIDSAFAKLSSKLEVLEEKDLQPAKQAHNDKQADLPVPTDFESLRDLVTQAHVAIRDVTLRIDNSIETSINEIRRAIGMPAVGAADNEGAQRQRAALDDIARRQQNVADVDSDEERLERQKIAAEIVARRGGGNKQEQQHDEQQQPNAYEAKRRAPYEELGQGQAKKELRNQHPEDAKYDAFRQAGYQHDDSPHVASPVGGQTRLKVNDPVADIEEPERKNVKRAAMVKEAMLSAWGAYKRYAWGHDELKPVSKTHHDWGGKNSKGMALTAVDSLSTLWLMGLHEEFDDAVKLVTEEVDYDQNIQVSVFEYTIRVVGGLLSAYELSGETNPRLLSTAQRMMDKLLVAYNTTTGIPHQTCNLQNKKHWGSEWAQGSAILSEFGSVQLELRTLSYHTKDPKYDIKGTHLMDITETQCKANNGLCPTFFDTHTSQARNDQLTLGALGDSYYEYLLKQYLLTGRSEPRYERMALEALDEAVERLLQFSSGTKQAFFADYMEGMLDMKMDHLACFSGGMYALAADTFPTYKHVKTFKKVAEGITRTCNLFYERVLSGLSPESVVFTGGMDFVIAEPYNLLRPEALESMFYQWRMTKDQKYRDWAWEIFLRYYTYCKTPSGGFAGVEIVTLAPPDHDDTQQSYFLAETLKYLYLIFAEDEVLDLGAWVFNTEAHPFKIRHRDPMQIWRDWEVSHKGQPAYMPPTINGVTVRTETDAMKEFRGDQPIFALRDPLSFEEPPYGET